MFRQALEGIFGECTTSGRIEGVRIDVPDFVHQLESDESHRRKVKFKKIQSRTNASIMLLQLTV